MDASMRRRIMISDREYSSWHFVDPDTYVPIPLSDSGFSSSPAELRLFTNDLIDISVEPPALIHSPVRSAQIPAILVLDGNKTFGRTPDKKRLLYKCIPNDRFLPAFLVPYAPEIGFSKTLQNRFVVFKFASWDGTHPRGLLVENLGEVGNLEAFYEYQLYCRSLHDSISEFNKVAKRAIVGEANAGFSPRFQSTHSNEKPRVFSIDPPGASDQDDALSITPTPTGAIVRVYIENVFLCLERLGLWKSFCLRVSTIYLPDFKRPMLPTVLSDQTCSLTQDAQREAFCMEVEVSADKIIPDSIRFSNQTICVAKNYAYESRELLADPDYQRLLECTKRLDPAVSESTDVVAHWMIQMNVLCGELLKSRGVGIFRQASWHPDTKDIEEPHSITAAIDSLPNSIPIESKRLIANWRHTTGQYVAFNKDHPVEHATMGKVDYVHITSPIRRIVDLLNQIVFQREFIDPRISPEATEFVEHWLTQLDYINATMRSIKKVQLDCDMIHRCLANPEWTETTHPGVLFDRIHRTDGLYSYMVHLQDLKMLGRITTQEKYENYTVERIKMFVFQDEERLHRKVRLGVVNGDSN
jgi:exoribonuclease R